MLFDFISRPIAITDVETTGLDPAMHEIIDIGLVVVNQKTLEIIETLDVRVKPKNIKTATSFALNLNGYNEADWQNALTLQEAMRLYSAKTEEAIFAAHNVTFDWSFIFEAFNKTKIRNLMDYHRIDLFTMAWLKLKDSGLKKFNGDAIAKHLGLKEEPLPHRGINGAMKAYEVFKKLIEIK